MSDQAQEGGLVWGGKVGAEEVCGGGGGRGTEVYVFSLGNHRGRKEVSSSF